MAVSAPSLGNLGFLTILQDQTGYLGGYLVTNQWGRPLEFRVSTPVLPNRIHHVLYGDQLEPYICGDLIGKTLIDKTTAPAHVIITDHPRALEMRLQVNVPIVWLNFRSEPEALATGLDGPSLTLSAREDVDELVVKNFRCHPRYPEDVKTLRKAMDETGGVLDLAEPFIRVREAIAEARKMGVAGRG